MEILAKILAGRKVAVTWIAAVAAIAFLGFVRHSTEAEYAFASAAIIPVFLVSWAGGLGHGVAAALLAAGMWVAADALSGAAHHHDWTPFFNGLVRLANYCFVAYLTARVRTLLQREIEWSTHDALTGLRNRRAFLNAGNTEANRARRYAKAIAVVFVDLDDFKKLNDTRGHDAGDAALQAVAAALRQSLRATDTVARLGGDEFAIILPEIGAVAGAEASRKIAAAVAATLASYPPVAASLGVAWFEHPQEDFDVMLKAADALMYEMKDAGKGGVRIRRFS